MMATNKGQNGEMVQSDYFEEIFFSDLSYKEESKGAIFLKKGIMKRSDNSQNRRKSSAIFLKEDKT
ncbi:hypothetical protein [Streptococcus sp. E24BD]